MKWFVSLLARSPFLRLYIRYIKYILNTVPWIGILLLFIWSYNVFIINFAYPDLHNGYLKRGGIHFVMYHILGILCFWSYYATAFVRPVKISLDPLEEEEYERIKSLLKQKELSEAAHPNMKVDIPYYYNRKYCKHCDNYKPERAHHCGWCESCILKMDHHCPWVGNCIGAHNYKYFILMLQYTTIFTCYVALSVFLNISTIEKYKSDPGATVLTLGAIALALSIGTAMLLFFHLFLLFTNSTTLEIGMRLSDCASCKLPPSAHDYGWKSNFMSVFGTETLYWFLPVKNQIPKARLRRLVQQQGTAEETVQLIVQ